MDFTAKAAFGTPLRLLDFTATAAIFADGDVILIGTIVILPRGRGRFVLSLGTVGSWGFTIGLASIGSIVTFGVAVDLGTLTALGVAVGLGGVHFNVPRGGFCFQVAGL